MTDMQISDEEKKVLVYMYLKYGMGRASESLGTIKERVFGKGYKTTLKQKSLVAGGFYPQITKKGLEVIKDMI